VEKVNVSDLYVVSTKLLKEIVVDERFGGGADDVGIIEAANRDAIDKCQR